MLITAYTFVGNQICVFNHRLRLKKFIRCSSLWSPSSRRGTGYLLLGSPGALGPIVVCGLSSMEYFLQPAVPSLRKTTFFIYLRFLSPLTIHLLQSGVGVQYPFASYSAKTELLCLDSLCGFNHEPHIYVRMLQDLLSLLPTNHGKNTF